jgi:O-antigen/teichoic acid export membrane protein
MKDENKEENYTHILKYTGIFGGVQGLNIIVGLVRNKCVAYLLGPSGMGLVALFNSVVNFVSQATNMGISFSAVRHVSELFEQGDEERITHFVKVVRAWSLLTALLGMLLCVIAGPLLSSKTFSWGDHTLHFMLLAPAVGLLAITGGETAILKGARRLKSLAAIQVFTIVISLIITIPIYAFFGQAGIVPVIVLGALTTMLLTIRYSYRLYPLQLTGAKGILGEGMEMVRLGMAFVVAGIMGSGAEMLIRSFLNVEGELDVVGLYNAGFMLTMTYAGMVFSAMETDYFPRLSAVGNDVEKLNMVVNRQSEVTLLIVSPMLPVMMLLLPVLIPILFRSDFLPVVAMAQVILLSMYVRAVYLPMAYITLAKGDSIHYFMLEAAYDILVVVFVIVGYLHWGLTGTGIAIALANVCDILLTYAYTSIRYQLRISSSVLWFMGIQLPLGIGVYILTFIDNAVLYWGMGCLLCLVSMMISIYILHQKSSLWTALVEKLKSRFSHHA